MRQLTAVLLNPAERREVARAERWVGIHPEADVNSGRKQPRRENESVRQMIYSTLQSISDGTEPIWGERLDRARTMLSEMLGAAEEQSTLDYWLTRGTAALHAEPLVTARQEAWRDVQAALAVLDEARGYTQDVRPYVLEDDKEED